MPFNGSGTFLRVMNWTNDAIAGIRVRADRHDDEDNNLAQGLSQCITKDGQTTITANLPMANYRHTNVGEATAATQYARYDQVQLGKAVWASAGGTADAITATYSPNTIAPVDGQLYYVRAGFANATTTPTFSPDGNTARVIVKNGNQALSAGDIAGDGHELILRYRSSDTKYEILNPAVTGVAVLSANNTFTGNNTFSGNIIYPDDGELTISSGAITVTGVYHTVDTEGDAATDDLVTINGGSDGQILVLRTENDSRDVVIKTSGNIATGGVNDITLGNTNTQIVLQYDGAKSKWLVQSATAAQGALADTALQSSLLTSWLPYTPVISGAGTVTGVFARSRRVGGNLECYGYFTSGTVSGSEFRISLGFNGTEGNVTTDNSGLLSASTQIVGEFSRADTYTGTHFAVLAIQNVGYVTVSTSGTVGGLTPATGSQLMASTTRASFKFSVPIEGWQ